MAEKKGFFGEFKEFIARGNVMDMAVGVIIGGAFGKISTSLVNDVIMPAVSMLTGGVDFSAWKVVLKETVVENGEEIAAAVTDDFNQFFFGISPEEERDIILPTPVDQLAREAAAQYRK